MTHCFWVSKEEVWVTTPCFWVSKEVLSVTSHCFWVSKEEVWVTTPLFWVSKEVLWVTAHAMCRYLEGAVSCLFETNRSAINDNFCKNKNKKRLYSRYKMLKTHEKWQKRVFLVFELFLTKKTPNRRILSFFEFTKLSIRQFVLLFRGRREANVIKLRFNMPPLRGFKNISLLTFCNTATFSGFRKS